MPNSYGQTAYPLYPVAGVPGQPADFTSNKVLSYIAASQIYPGRLCQLAADGVSLQMVQNTGGTLNKVVGISMFSTVRPGMGNFNQANYVPGSVFNAGDVVPVMQEGAIFAEWSGTTQAGFTQPNVYHSSTIATNQGKFTDAATSSTAGSEVTTAAGQIQIRDVLPGSGNIVLIDINLP